MQQKKNPVYRRTNEVNFWLSEKKNSKALISLRSLSKKLSMTRKHPPRLWALILTDCFFKEVLYFAGKTETLEHHH